MRRSWVLRMGLAALAGLGAAATAPAGAAPEARASARASDREAAELQAAFGRDLCARDDRELRKLNRALAARPAGGAR